MFDLTLTLGDAVLPVQLPHDLMASVGQAGDPNNPTVPKPTKLTLDLLGDTMPSVGQIGDPNNPGVPPSTK